DGFYSSGMSYGQASTLRGADGSVTYGWRVAQELYTAYDGFYSSGMSYGQASTLRGADGSVTYGWRVAQE
ncbi:hypothetical protein CQA15_29675, partial [Klebsiella pneumoniae]|uniref:hypothetical protein n=1 Tax=Klebsiella pneumoniae TaxID=573 RepID=UPI000BDBD5D8